MRVMRKKFVAASMSGHPYEFRCEYGYDLDVSEMNTEYCCTLKIVYESVRNILYGIGTLRNSPT